MGEYDYDLLGPYVLREQVEDRYFRELGEEIVAWRRELGGEIPEEKDLFPYRKEFSRLSLRREIRNV